MTQAPRRPTVAILRHTQHYHRSVSRAGEALVEEGFDCDFFYIGKAGQPRVRWENGVRIIRIPGLKSRGGAARYMLEYGTFLTIAATVLGWQHLRRRYRMVQVYTMPDFLVLAPIIPRLFGAKVLGFMQEPAPELGEALGHSPGMVTMMKRFEQLALRFANGSIAVTNDLRQRFIERGADGRKIAVVLNCSTSTTVTDAVRSRPVDDPEVWLIYHGTVEHRWGYDNILDALALARVEAPHLRLVLTGSGTYVDEVLRRRDKLNLGDIVSWEGYVSEQKLGELLKSSDIGIVAQKASSYSHLVQTTKMYDFWAVGLPVIASRLHATAAMYDDTQIAYYTPDDPADLARQFVRLAHDPALRSRYAAAGRCAYQHFGWAAQREVYLRAVRNLLADQPLAINS